MSTDWIKMRCDLRTHPKVVRMAGALGADKLRVVGALHAVWSIFDAHSADGILDGYTFKAIDIELGWKGFAQAMSDIGWLVDVNGRGLETPRFEEHNGQSAKRRAMETERKRLEREAEKAAADAAKAATKAGQASASDADKSVTREEKRREETKKNPSGSRPLAEPPDQSAPQPTIPCPYGSIVDAYHRELPTLPKVRLRDGPTWTTRQKAMRTFWGWVLSSRKSDGSRRAETAEQALVWISGYFGRARDNDFVMGRRAPGPGHDNWRADFDFLLSPKGMKQVIEKTAEAA